MTPQVQTNGAPMTKFIPFAMRWAETYQEAKAEPVAQMFSANVDGITTEVSEPDKPTPPPQGEIGGDTSFTIFNETV